MYQNFQVSDGSQLQVIDNGLRIVSLAELKAQMRVEESDEDNLIMTYGQAAEASVLRETRRSVDELCVIGYQDYHGHQPEETPGLEYFPAPLKVAILALAASQYENRSVNAAVSISPVPYSLAALVKPYVRLKQDD